MVIQNLLANYLGQAWVGLMGLVFVPVYIRYLGVEAYGLIGIFALMQAWLSLLDMGMSSTLNREMARFNAGAHSPRTIRDLLRTLEVLCVNIAVAIMLAVWTGSDYIASHWLRAEQLAPSAVARAVSVIALVAALRFCEGIYRGSLFGLQRQVWYNAANSALATVRHGGAIGILAWVSPTIDAFFLWQAVISLVAVTLFAVKVHLTLPPSPSATRISRAALVAVWQFAAGMMGITFLSLLLTQVDKILLSRLLSLESFGYYALAAAVAGTLYMVVLPVTQAVYPQLVEFSTRDNTARLIGLYHQSAQLITVLTGPAALLLWFFAEGVLFTWSGDADLSAQTAPILAALVLGTLLHALMHMPYQLQLAHGWTSLAIKTNVVAVALLVPAIFWVVPRYGALGAARLWLLLNLGYVLFVIELMHRRLLPAEKWRWYRSDVLLPLAGPLAAVLFARTWQPQVSQNRVEWFVFLTLTGVLAAALATICAPAIRNSIGRRAYDLQRHSPTLLGPRG